MSSDRFFIFREILMNVLRDLRAWQRRKESLNRCVELKSVEFRCSNFNIYQVVIFLTALSCGGRKEDYQGQWKLYFLRSTLTAFFCKLRRRQRCNFYGLSLTSFLSPSSFYPFRVSFVSCFTMFWDSRTGNFLSYSRFN
jgi:hypothetical protein